MRQPPSFAKPRARRRDRVARRSGCRVRAQEPPAEPAAAPKAEKSGPHAASRGRAAGGRSRRGDLRRVEDARVRRSRTPATTCCASTPPSRAARCAVIEFTPEIAPGAEGKVAVRFDAALSGGPSAVPIEVVSNDPDEPDAAAHHQGRRPLLHRCAARLRALPRGPGLRRRQHGEADLCGHRRQPDAASPRSSRRTTSSRPRSAKREPEELPADAAEQAAVAGRDPHLAQGAGRRRSTASSPSTSITPSRRS